MFCLLFLCSLPLIGQQNSVSQLKFDESKTGTVFRGEKHDHVTCDLTPRDFTRVDFMQHIV